MSNSLCSCISKRTDSEDSDQEDEKTKISKINNYLYLSGCLKLKQRHLDELKITCAINCIKGINHHFSDHIEYVHLQLEDEEKENLRPHFQNVMKLIDKHRKNVGRTLVYCGLGISRSASFVIAYMMQYDKLSLLDAYKCVQQKRSIICPNVGFFRQLLEMEKTLYNQQTVSIIEPAPGVEVPDVVWQEVYQEVVDKMARTGVQPALPLHPPSKTVP